MTYHDRKRDFNLIKCAILSINGVVLGLGSNIFMNFHHKMCQFRTCWVWNGVFMLRQSDKCYLSAPFELKVLKLCTRIIDLLYQS